jgi:hypothetical protein
MLEHLTWHQTANIAWIAGAVGFGWGLGRGIADDVLAVLSTRVSRWWDSRS